MMIIVITANSSCRMRFSHNLSSRYPRLLPRRRRRRRLVEEADSRLGQPRQRSAATSRNKPQQAATSRNKRNKPE